MTERPLAHNVLEPTLEQFALRGDCICPICQYDDVTTTVWLANLRQLFIDDGDLA